MAEKRSNRFSWSWALCACGAGSAAIAGVACTSGGERAGASTEMQAETFAPAPAQALRGVLTERRSSHSTIAGTALRSHDEQELRWRVSSDRSGSGFLVAQQLVHITLKHDGVTIIDRDVRPGSVTAAVTLDRLGFVVEVRGLDSMTGVVRRLAAPSDVSYALQALAPRHLERLITARYYETTGVAGRSLRAGTTWATHWAREDGQRSTPVTAKSTVVEGLEPCGGSTTCVRLRTASQLDPRLLADDVSPLVDTYVGAHGGAGPSFDLKTGKYWVNGVILTDPTTLASRQAALAENGHVRVRVGGKNVAVDVHGTDTLLFDPGAR